MRDNAYVQVHEEGQLIVKPGVGFDFHASWLLNDPSPSTLAIARGATLEVLGDFKIFSGASVYVNKEATLKLGSGYSNNHLTLHCYAGIDIGEDVAIAEQVVIRDSDNHFISSEPPCPMCAPIRIGNHVWVGVRATILKGVTIGDGAIIAAGAVVTHDVPPHCLAAGVPARVVREGVSWS